MKTAMRVLGTAGATIVTVLFLLAAWLDPNPGTGAHLLVSGVILAVAFCVYAAFWADW